MTRRNLRYDFLPRQGEAVGVCHLVHPFLDLWSQTKARFLRETVQMVAEGVEPPRLADLLEETGFGPGTYSLDEWFQPYQAPPVRLAWDGKSLGKLAETVEDLTRDNGLWKESAADLDSAAHDALADLRRRLEQLRQQLAVRYGPGAVRAAFVAVRQAIEEQARMWNTPVPWTCRLTEELRQAAQTLRSYASPRGLTGKALLRFRPGLEASWWLSDGQRRNLERKLFPVIVKANQLRFAQEQDRRKRRVAEALLGRPGVRGLIDQLLADSLAQEDYFQGLATAITAAASESALGPNSLCTAATLDAVLDPARKRTVGDLYQEAIAKAGRSAKEFAAQLHHDGLPLHGRAHPPVEWAQAPLPSVLAALHRAADLYLGAADLHASLQIEEPRTAFEAAAAITLVHPELEPLVKNLLPALAERSRPFAEINHLAGGEPTIHAILYCFPADRPRWERFLQTRVTLANPRSVAGNATAYQVRHPYLITLAQFAVAVPLGALRSLPSWARQSNSLQKKGTAPLFDLKGLPEVRRLAQRPTDEEDSHRLFDAACQARVFLPVGSQTPVHYVLAVVDARLELVFAPATVVPGWKTDEDIHQALGRTNFVRSLEVAFPEIVDLNSTIAKLAREQDAQQVATEMVRLGILESGSGGRLFRLRCQENLGSFPMDFFRQQKSTVRGLTAEACMAELHRNDDLYNAVFWQLCDALDLGRVSRNDVPEFLGNFVKSL